jgi:hypothetical protein
MRFYDAYSGRFSATPCNLVKGSVTVGIMGIMKTTKPELYAPYNIEKQILNTN